MPEVSKHTRRRFQFSMTMLLLLVALVASLTAVLIAYEQLTRPDRVQAIEIELQEMEAWPDFHRSKEDKARLEQLRKKLAELLSR